MAEIRRSNPKAFKELTTRIEALAGQMAKVGWFENAKYPGSNRPVAAVAAGNELGIPSRSIPARPFMRPAAADDGKTWSESAAKLSARVVQGKMTAHDAMDTLAGIAEGSVAKHIEAVTSPPLSPITLGARKYRRQGKTVTGGTIGEIARKLKDGSLDISGVPDKPLDDSGHMIATLTHVTEGV